MIALAEFAEAVGLSNVAEMSAGLWLSEGSTGSVELSAKESKLVANTSKSDKSMIIDLLIPAPYSTPLPLPR